MQHYKLAADFLDVEAGAKYMKAMCMATADQIVYDVSLLAVSVVDNEKYKSQRDSVVSMIATEYERCMLALEAGNVEEASCNDWQGHIWVGPHGIVRQAKKALQANEVCKDLVYTIISLQLE